MKPTRILIFSALAATTLGLSSCVVDEPGYAVAEVSPAPVIMTPGYYRDPYYRGYYGPRHNYHHRGDYHRGGYHGHSHGLRGPLHNAMFH